MKKSTFFVLTFLAALTLGSCKKKTAETEATNNNGNPTLSSLAFKLDGTSNSPLSQTVQRTSGKIFIAGSSNPNESISISITDTLAPGSYTFGPNGFDAFRMFYTPDNYATSYTSQSGTGTIVSHDMTNNKIQATFNCMLVSNGATPDTIYVTNGEINKTYPE